MLFVMLPIVGVAIVGIACAWVFTYREIRQAKVVERPQTIALAGVLAATMQVPLPFVMAAFFAAPRAPGIEWIAALELLFFLVALPCALLRKGPARWWLAFSSVFFLALTGFVYAVSGLQF